jgi:hypothetical protein
VFVERRIVVSECLVVVPRAACTLVTGLTRLTRTHQVMLSDEVGEELAEAPGNVADCAT